MKNFKKVLSLMLVAVMVMGSLAIAPMNASAEGTYTKVTSASDITAGGNFVLVAEHDGGHYALGTTISGKINATEITLTDGVPSGDNIPVWTVAATTNGVSLSNGSSYLAYSGSSTNFASAENTDSTTAEWTVTLGDDNGFRFTNVSGTTRGIAYQISGNRFGAYSTTNDVAGSTEYVFGLTVYKYSGTVVVPEDIELEEDATPEEIVEAAYEAMENGVDLLGTWELTGVITEIGTAFNSTYNNISITMQVGDMEENPIGCFRLTVEDITDADALAELQGLAVGDTVTVEGTLGYYNTTVQFTAGCILKDVVKATDAPQNIELEEDATPEEIVEAAYQAMEDGVSLLGTWELTGVITAVNNQFNSSFNNITVTMQIGDMEDMPIQCYRLSIADVSDADALAELAGLAVGDTITVSGTLSYYNGTVQYAQGCVLTEVVKSENPPEDIELEADATEEEIVEAAYEAMENGVSLLGTWELTGVITEINTEYSDSFKNISVTIQVGDMEDMPIQCFRLTVADKENEDALAVLAGLEVGDTITAQGTFTYYNTTVEMSAGCVLLEVNGEPVVAAPGTADVRVLVPFAVLGVSALALAVVELKKRR